MNGKFPSVETPSQSETGSDALTTKLPHYEVPNVPKGEDAMTSLIKHVYDALRLSPIYYKENDDFDKDKDPERASILFAEHCGAGVIPDSIELLSLKVTSFSFQALAN